MGGVLGNYSVSTFLKRRHDVLSDRSPHSGEQQCACSLSSASLIPPQTDEVFTIYVKIYTHMHTHTLTHTHPHAHTHAHTHTLTYKHTHIHTRSDSHRNAA